MEVYLATDTPTRKLQDVVNLLVGMRGWGRATRVREGYLPYSSDLDFRGINEATGQTWETATGALPALAKRIITETVGAGAAWASLLTRLQAAQAMLYAAISLIDGDTTIAPAAGVVNEAIQQVVPADVQARLLESLRTQAATFALIIHALETGDYLTTG